METSGKFRIVAAVCALIVGLSAPAPAKVIHVDDGAVGVNKGSSWADAFLYLQDALAVALAGDEIQVAQGTYRPDQGAGIKPGDRQSVFHLAEGIILRGGYAGVGAPDPNARNIELYQTILSGDCKGDDPDVQDAGVLASLPSRADNSFHVVVIRQVDSCVLDGFIIRGGHALDGGGGLQIQDSNPTLWNCTFTQNWGPKGGAIFIPRGGRLFLSGPKIHHCKFTVNSSTYYGGGLHAEDDNLLLTDCEFLANTSSYGGAVSSGPADTSLSGCMFRGNRAVNGGGLYHTGGNLHLTGCTFVENAASPSRGIPYGGAVYIDISSTSQATVADCLFRNNRADYGGAIHGNPTVLRGCRFTGNVADRRYGVLDCSRALTAENCLFDGNQALDSIGVAQCYGPLEFTNCTFVDNRSPDGNTFRASGGHGTVAASTFINCIVWGTGHGLDPQKSWLAKTSVTYCDVEGGYPGAGNIDLDPRLADLGHWDPNGTLDDPSDDFWVEGDCHLKSQAGRWDPITRMWVQDAVTSPCIDAGNPASPLGDEPLPNGGRINMGAYGGTTEASKSYY